jgi:tetratricopeptide (TPR) repeat protein
MQRQGLWVRTEGAQAALDSMEAVLGEARAALRFALVADPDAAAELAWSMDPLFEGRGLGVFRAEVATLVEHLDHPRARLFRAREARWRGDLDAAEALFDGLPDGHRALGLASIALQRGQDPRPWLDQAEFPDDREWQARLQGMRAVGSADPEAALREAEAMHRLRGDVRGQSLVLAKLAGELADEGRLDEAVGCIQHARRHSEALGDVLAMAVQGGLLGLLRHLLGELDEAEQVYTESISALAGRPRSQAIARLNRAFLRIEAGPSPDGARDEFFLIRQGWPGLAAWAALGLSIIEEHEGRPKAAARWRERAGGARPPAGSAEAVMLARVTQSPRA